MPKGAGVGVGEPPGARPPGSAASGDCAVMDDGPFPCGHSHDHLPNLPQVTVSRGQAPVAAPVRQRGWQVSVPTEPPQQLSLQEAALAYHLEDLVEQAMGRLKGRPMSLTPRSLERDDQVTGLIRL